MSKRLHLFCFVIASLAPLSSACGDSCFLGIGAACYNPSEEERRISEETERRLDEEKKQIDECIDQLLKEEEKKNAEEKNRQEESSTLSDEARRDAAREICVKKLFPDRHPRPPRKI